MALLEVVPVLSPPACAPAHASVPSPLPAPSASPSATPSASSDLPREAQIRAKARGVQALDLRLARVLAFIRDQPLETLGYPGWQAFCRERVDWCESWVRDMVRLVRSGLDDVIAAACRGDLPLAVAVKAPRWCLREGQEAWLAAARDGTLPPRPKARPRGASSTVLCSPSDQVVIWHARQKARLLTGLSLSDREADTRILGWWRDRRDDLVETALAPAPVPVPADFGPAWGVDDLATGILGPWRAPTTLEDALAMMEAIQKARRGRIAALGEAYESVVRLGLHHTWGYASLEEFCRRALGLSARSLQRYRELGRALRRFQPLAQLPHTKAAAVGRIARRWDLDRWIGVAKRTGVTELCAAVAHVEAGADPDALLDAYEAAMAATTTTVALDSVKVPVPPTLTDRVHPDLPRAARWLLEEVVIPPQRGFGRVKELEHFICFNPECRRCALRNHAHHRVPRAHGGGDERGNGECQCPSCHLRLIHAGRVRVEERGEGRAWIYPDRVVTVFPGPALY